MVKSFRPYAIQFRIRRVDFDGGADSRELLKLMLDAPSDSALAWVRGLDCQETVSMLVPEDTSADELVREVGAWLRKHGWKVELPR